MSDIVQRLRKYAIPAEIVDEAADEIERLRAALRKIYDDLHSALRSDLESGLSGINARVNFMKNCPRLNETIGEVYRSIDALLEGRE